ncbi:phage virion morphogenesis protein [Acinetobacter baumannii]|uniref:phage virion morphogenesis protein n=1 Tax=Acinetobacter baumannii TaxID=470 RepID=UPI00074317E5|nr:phage virion morphogenesis protein [Acinetobacter baumannii]ATP85854.1 Phage virion morphogenesis family protein [Acinetobacter baumannii]MCF4279119.1 phage virion morphogenesis protein [Acinetobacter baumannii]MCF4286829.1 phage virion morphogenesis protein [Acinetobacter baumannii]MCF4297813.1 phage virion morphogenesis protein [Acinetobacter baumannii]MCF4394815.1 phage virion morphogenesis protein [Acinetobacter baumannii]
MNNIQDLALYLQPLLDRLSAGERAKLAKNIGRDLRTSQRQRITAQQNPDGSAFTARRTRLRDQKGKIKRKMFSQIKSNTHLKVLSNSESIAVGFIGRVSRIAKVHQYGLRDRATRSAPDTVYPKRELLGFTDKEINLVESSFIKHINIK